MPQVAFAGTPEFALPSLRSLAATGCGIPLVLTQPDRPAGRGRRVAASPVKREALDRGLRVRQPVRLDPHDAPPRDWGRRPDLLVVAAYGLLLPPWLLDWPESGAVNVHPSLLPRWRGAAPIQCAILAGDPETGISLMKMDAGLDTGPVYCRRKLTIEAGETTGGLHDRLARLGGELLAAALPDILDGCLEPAPQDEARATHAPRIRKSDAVLDWTRSAVALERQVRAFNPWPVSETMTAAGERVRIWDAVALSGGGKTADRADAAAEGGHAAAGPTDAAARGGRAATDRTDIAAGRADILSGGGETAADRADTLSGGRETIAGRASAPPGTVVRTGAAGIDVAAGVGVLRILKLQQPGGKPMTARAFLNAHAFEDQAFGG